MKCVCFMFCKILLLLSMVNGDQHVVWSSNLVSPIKQVLDQHIVRSSNLDCLIKHLFKQHICWSCNRVVDQSIVCVNVLFDHAIEICSSNKCFINIFFWSSNLDILIKQLFGPRILIKQCRWFDQAIVWSTHALT